MWIRTQDKQRLINSNKIADIFINKTGNAICALVDVRYDRMAGTLGEYENRDDCLRVLDVMTRVVGNKACEWLCMPDDNDIEGWAKRIESQLL